MAIRKIINMKYFYDPIYFNLLERQEEGFQPHCTDIAPPSNIAYNQFAKFDTENQKWILRKRKEYGYHMNLNDLSLIRPDQFEDFDDENYCYNILQNYGDVIINHGNRIEYQVASNTTLDFFKNRQLAKLRIAYEKAQVAKIINGITFFTPLMGEFYNTTAQVRKSKAEARNDRLMYIRVPAIDGKEYESKLPVDFYNLIDNKLDEISLQNNKIKRRYEIEIANFTKVDEIISLQFNFPAIQDISINNLADDFIANTSNRKEDRDYLASLNKKFFIEFI